MRHEEVPIGELVTNCTTWSPRKEGDGTFEYVDLSSIDKEQKCITAVERYECANAPSRARKLLKTNDVLVATVRPNLNGVALVETDHDGMTASTGYCVLRPLPKRLDSKYLFHWVKTDTFVQRMIDVATGANYPAVSSAKVKTSTIPFPPLAEQKRIAGILDAADTLRAKRRESLDQLDALVESTFLEIFGDPVTNPKGWELKALGEILKVKSGKSLVAKDMAPAGEFPVYGGNGISGYHDSFMFHEPKIVLGRVGFYCGAVHLTEPKSWITDNALYVRELFQPVDTTYLVSAIKAADLNQYAGRAAQPLISGRRIYPVQIPIPPMDLQRRFAGIVQAVDEQKTRLRTHLDQLNRLFESLQHRAFTGRL